MGFLINKFIKDEKKKDLAIIFVDVLLIIFLLLIHNYFYDLTYQQGVLFAKKNLINNILCIK